MEEFKDKNVTFIINGTESIVNKAVAWQSFNLDILEQKFIDRPMRITALLANF